MVVPFYYRLGWACKSHIPFLESSLFLGLCTSGALLVLVIGVLGIGCAQQTRTENSEDSEDSEDSKDSDAHPSGQHGGVVVQPLCRASQPEARADQREGHPKGEQMGQGPGRSCYVNNCRFVLETLVVMGHVSQHICHSVWLSKGYAL